MSSTITSLETITNQNAPGLPEDKFNSLRNLIMDHKADPSNEIFNSQALIAYLPGDASQYEKKIIDTTMQVYLL